MSSPLRSPRALALALIRRYRRWFSPASAPRCRYYPTCSAYAEQAVSELGLVRGAILAGWRVVRCNPLSRGGVDELDQRRFFRAPRRPRSGSEGLAR